MDPSQNENLPMLKLGDELLLPIVELLCIADVISCSLVRICKLPSGIILTQNLGEQSITLCSSGGDDSSP